MVHIMENYLILEIDDLDLQIFQEVRRYATNLKLFMKYNIFNDLLIIKLEEINTVIDLLLDFSINETKKNGMMSTEIQKIINFFEKCKK